MGEFRGRLTVPGVVDWPLSVKIALEEETISIAAAGFPIGVWSLDEVEVESREQGFEIKVDGEYLYVSTNDDVVFASALGIDWSAPASGGGAIGRLGNAGSGVRNAPESTAELGSDLRRQLVVYRSDDRTGKLSLGRGKHQRRRRGRHAR